jgi:phosphatidylglycerophosphate synthase
MSGAADDGATTLPAGGPGVIRQVGVPNLLSLSRLPLAAAFLLAQDTVVRVVIIAAAGISDWLDGWWARTRGPRTATGALLDPVTDKAFVVTALASFAVWDAITPAQLAVLLARDLYVTLGALVLVLLRQPLRLAARVPGKLVTVLQIGAVLVLTVAPHLARLLVPVIGAAAAWAIIDYTIAALNGRSRLRAPPRPR